MPFLIYLERKKSSTCKNQNHKQQPKTSNSRKHWSEDSRWWKTEEKEADSLRLHGVNLRVSSRPYSDEHQHHNRWQQNLKYQTTQRQNKLYLKWREKEKSPRTKWNSPLESGFWSGNWYNRFGTIHRWCSATEYLSTGGERVADFEKPVLAEHGPQLPLRPPHLSFCVPLPSTLPSFWPKTRGDIYQRSSSQQQGQRKRDRRAIIEDWEQSRCRRERIFRDEGAPVLWIQGTDERKERERGGLSAAAPFGCRECGGPLMLWGTGWKTGSDAAVNRTL